jgi:hypothetical protein
MQRFDENGNFVNLVIEEEEGSEDPAVQTYFTLSVVLWQITREANAES